MHFSRWGSAHSAALLTALISLTGHAFAIDWSKLGFHGGDTRLYTQDGDWFYGYTKGECGGDFPAMAGVASGVYEETCTILPFLSMCSASSDFTDAILCVKTNLSIDLARGYTLNSYYGDDRRDDSDRLNDWAPNQKKLECGPTEVMVALAQSWDPSNRSLSGLVGARCAPANISGWTSCSVRNFSWSDARESSSRGDWDYNYHKGECGPGRYVKGVASHGFGRATSIMCCTPY